VGDFFCHEAMAIARVRRWCWQPKKKNEQSGVLSEIEYSFSFGSQIGATSFVTTLSNKPNLASIVHSHRSQ
jgi:hypothetical protein